MILAYRISAKLVESDGQFDELVEFLKQYRSAVDEISLFTEYWHHGYFPLAEFAGWAGVLGRRIRRLHEEGFRSVGINMLDTIGHLNEAWDFLPPLPFPAMVGHDGSVSRGCFCPNSKDFREYVLRKYALVAKADPDFIWVDDDIRMHNHGVAWGCFCPTCLKVFGHGEWSREGLVAELNRQDAVELRAAWVEHNATVLEGLLVEIEQGVHAVDAGIDIGLMTCGPGWTTYSGQALDRWHRALKARRSRPGGGFYDDNAPRAMINKALEVGRGAVPLPPEIETIQYELEDFPYQKLDKSARSVLNECTLALAAGCNGIAFNALKDLPGSLMDYHDLLKAITAERPRWERMVKTGAELQMAGLWPAFDDHVMARRRVTAGDWFSFPQDCNIGRLSYLAEIGLPLTIDRRGACGVVLSGRMADAFSDDDLRAMLAGGVILDATALGVLWERGLGELAGVKAGRTFDNGVYERFTDYELNGGFAGDARDVRLSFWGDIAAELVPVGSNVGVAARLVGFDGSDCGACISTYANPQGGRIVTLGYGPWTRLSSSAKRSQMIALADWACGGRLPVVIDKTVRVTPFVRLSEDRGRGVVVLLNTAFDPTGPLNVRLRAECTKAVRIAAGGEKPLRTRRGRGETIVAVPSIQPWQNMVIELMS